ncbi:DUF3892 domain-containing protein [Archangium violaceum]|uniref:DUF3892 domain-containing protein n=1 Tax=Archangium violaceum TaxID=83451 RepID=UPI002B2AF82D|nr:DUF3892 domain-containing protein [Archangium gephyra]
MSDGIVRFLPWVREGLVSGLPARASVADALPARAEVALSLEVTPGEGDRTPVVGGRTARVFGPGDVTALDPSQVIRVQPSADADGTEPTGFAAIEFDRPDLPWLFTPGGPDSRGRLRPWLFLVVVPWRADLLTQPTGPGLPRLTCAASELPDLAESWAWAHAQCFVLSGETVDSVLAQVPERTLSRLLCPRRLEPETSYLAALVPAFEAGRRAGLGLPLDAHEEGALVDAWNASQSTPVTLPVYHSWRFRTGAEGDFETLVRRLRPHSLPDEVGLRQVDVNAAGSGLPAAGVLGFEGALRAPGTQPTPWPEAVRGPWRTKLRELLDPSGTRLSPPVYGAVHAGPAGRPAAVPAEGAQPHWLRELNLDPRYRAAAALGANVVREYQEDLAAAAWEQAAALVEANAQLRTAQLARAAADVVYDKRLPASTATVAAGTGLAALAEASPQAGALLALTQPVHTGVTGTGGGTVSNQLAASPSVRAAVSPAFRRVTRPRGPLARRLGGSETTLARTTASTGPIGTQALLGLAATTRRVVPPAALPEGGSALDQLSADPAAPVRLRDITAQAIRDASTLRVRAREVAGVAEPPVATLVSAGVLSTPPGATLGGNRFFMGTTDGRLFERMYIDGHGIWRDHGTPPGAAVGHEVTALGSGAYVISTDGRLFRRHIDTGQWTWQAIPCPLGGLASGAVLTDYGELLVVSTDGRLFLFYTGGSAQGTWRDLGWPTVNGVRHYAVSTPMYTGAGANVTTTSGRLFVMVRTLFGGDWLSWHDLGVPAQQTLRPGPGGLPNNGFWASTQSGQVHFYSTAIMNGGWYATGPLSSGAVSSPGEGFGGHPSVATANGGLAAWNGSSWEALGTPLGGQLTAAARPGGYISTPDGVQRVHVRTNDGRLAAVRRFINVSTWEDHGFPADSGGTGGVGDAPVPEVRWAPQLGALSSLLVARLAYPALYQVQVEYRVARELGLDGQPTGGWDNTARTAPATYDSSVGIGVAAADLNGNGRPDLVVLTVSQMHWMGEQRGYAGYQIGWNLGVDGSPTGGWSEVRKLPDPLPLGLGEADLALADLDGDGKLELILAYVAGQGANTRLYYRIGWGITADGSMAGGWSHSIEVPITPGTVRGVGVTVADMNDDDLPDLVISLLQEDSTGKGSMAYLIGRQLNRRGRVVGGWSPLIPVGGAALGSLNSGMGLAVADFTGTRQPDLLVFYSGGSPQRSFYRIGYDLKPDGTARAWSPDIEVAPTFPTGGPLAVTLTDLDPALVARRNQMRDRFLTAAIRHQTYLAPAQAKAAESPPVFIDVPVVASTLRGSLKPGITVVDNTLARVPAARNTPATREVGADALRPLLAGVSFPQPTYELLRRISPESVLPGVELIPPDSITLLRANPAFVEAFLVGMNTEMSREMLWREFPADPRHTYFRQFWDVRGALASGSKPPADIPLISRWEDGWLGSHATGVGGAGAGNLLLVIRGELLRRYPSTRLTARRAAWDPAEPGRRILTATELQPLFSGWHAPDLLLFGFPLSARDARGSTTDPGWFFVLSEHLAAGRFGLDDPPEAGSPEATPPPATWNDVHWGHVAPAQVPAGRAPHAAIEGVPVTGHTLGGIRYGYNSAHQALIVTQRPVMVAVHATEMLSSLDDGWRVTAARRQSDRIVELGGERPDGTPWRMAVADVITAIDRGEYFYVQAPGTHPARVTVVHRANGTSYLRTASDSSSNNNLDSLPEMTP